MQLNDIPYSMVSAVVSGIIGLGLAVRAILTWMNRQGMIVAGDSAQKEIYERLSAEAKKWEERYIEVVRQHDEYIELITQLRTQNAMMRLLLIHNGLSPKEIDEMIEKAHNQPLGKG